MSLSGVSRRSERFSAERSLPDAGANSAPAPDFGANLSTCKVATHRSEGDFTSAIQNEQAGFG